jgi:RNA polymerase primary sigma factor
MFQRDVNMRPVLSREDEAAIARRARAGDQEAADLLIESNLRFVLKVVFQYYHPGLPIMDLISSGCLAMVRASKLFDPAVGVRFITYAHPGIVHQVHDYIRLHYHHSHESLDEPVYDDGDEITYKDLLASGDPGADETVFLRQIRKMLEDLDERERRVLILRYWVDLTHKEIGVKFGHTPQWARNIEAGALRKLRWARRA